MASGVSRIYSNSSLTHLHLGRLAIPCYKLTYYRTYATATANVINKNRPAVSPKRTSTKPDSSSSSNVAGKTLAQAETAGGGTTPKTSSSPSQVLSEKEQMEQLSRILTFSQLRPTADVWGQKVDTLDVMIPYPIISSRHSLGGIRGVWSQFWQNRLNGLKNSIGMVALATHNAFPGVNTAGDRFFKKLFIWPFYLFGTKSTRPKGWLAPTRRLAIEAYTQLNVAMARNDVKEIKRLTTDSFLANTLATQKRRSPAHTYIWRFHREVTPTQIVSLRTTEGYLSPEEPKFGNRLMVHALVKFDTEQSLEIYDRRGNALHEPAVDAPGLINGTIPAKKQHVVQYLVLEKRMWYDGPWLIRDQIWEVDAQKD